MAVEITIPQSARNMFQDGIEHVAQQMQSRFRGFATVKTGCTGKSQAHRKLQKKEMRDVTGRLQQTVGEENAVLQRFLFPRKAELTTWIDEDDAQDMDYQFGPTGETQTQHTAAASRKVDDIFIAGILGTNYEGSEDNIQTVALSQTVAVNYRRDGLTTNTGLTLAKLVRAKGRFGKLEVYGQEAKAEGARLCMAVSQDELDNLLFEVEQTGSSDYNKVKALVDGEVDYFMGINFMRSERLPFTTPGGGKIIRSCPIWVSTGVHLDFWYDIKTHIDVRTDVSHAVQVRSVLKVASGRKDEDRVVNVLCEQDA
jgi:hypothetical protein